MAKEEVEHQNAFLQPSPLFVEVTCKSTGKIRRFSKGTLAKFAINLINLKNGSSGGVKVPLALYIEAVKEGEEPVSFGDGSELVEFGDGWKLQTFTEPEGLEKEEMLQANYKQVSDRMMQAETSQHTGSYTTKAKPQNNQWYFGRISLALFLICILGTVFTFALENLPRVLQLISS